MTTDQTYGDLHQWNVWHGSQEPWHNWDILAGRFVSEFGMFVLHKAVAVIRAFKRSLGKLIPTSARSTIGRVELFPSATLSLGT